MHVGGGEGLGVGCLHGAVAGGSPCRHVVQQYWKVRLHGRWSRLALVWPVLFEASAGATCRARGS